MNLKLLLETLSAASANKIMKGEEFSVLGKNIILKEPKVNSLLKGFTDKELDQLLDVEYRFGHSSTKDPVIKGKNKFILLQKNGNQKDGYDYEIRMITKISNDGESVSKCYHSRTERFTYLYGNMVINQQSYEKEIAKKDAIESTMKTATDKMIQSGKNIDTIKRNIFKK